MSIWGSQSIAGEVDHDDDPEFDGSVISYIEGWSNHYPGNLPGREDQLPDGEVPAAIWTGWMPPWCVPGREDVEDEGLDVDTHLGPWLRLDLVMREVSIWDGPIKVGNVDVHSVCLNESAVTALRDNLNEWLDREKVHPETKQGVQA